MIRKDKLHIVLLVAVLLLCIAANGSVPTYEAGRTLSDLAGTAALADGPPEAGAEEAEITAPAAESAAPEEGALVPLYINGVLHSECLVVDGVARMSLGRFATLAGLSYDGQAIGGVTPELGEGG